MTVIEYAGKAPYALNNQGNRKLSVLACCQPQFALYSFMLSESLNGTDVGRRTVVVSSRQMMN